MERLLKGLLFLVFLTSSLGHFSLLPLNFIKLYLYDLFAFLFVILGFFYLTFSKKSGFMPIYFMYVFGFCIWAFITLILNISNLHTESFLTSFFYLIRFLLYVFISLTLYNLSKLNLGWVSYTVKLMLFSVVFVAVAGIIQLAIFPNLADLSPELGWDPHIYRLTSTFFDPNFVGGYLVLGFILVLSLYYNNAFSKINLIFLMSLLLVCLLLTFSRSSWFMFGICVFLIGLLKDKRLLLLTFLILFSAYYFVPRVQTRLSGITDPQDSAQYRLISWRNAIKISQNNLMYGVGFNAYRYSQEDYGFFDYTDPTGGHAGAGSDSSLLLVLATTGVFGFIYFVSFWLFIYAISLKDFIKTSSLYSFCLFVSLGGLFVHSQFVNSLFYAQYMLWIWSLVALAFVKLDLNRC